MTVVKGMGFYGFIYSGLWLFFVREYWEQDPSEYWEAEAMSLGYHGA